nr:hypothetical protein [Tanacetum cinerariifolium]
MWNRAVFALKMVCLYKRAESNCMRINIWSLRRRNKKLQTIRLGSAIPMLMPFVTGICSCIVQENTFIPGTSKDSCMVCKVFLQVNTVFVRVANKSV